MHQTKPRILYVDDHEDTLFLVTVLLNQAGYEVITTDSVAHGLELAQHEQFDLYLLDTKLPDGTGINLCEEIREFDHETPIIFYSADAYEAQQCQALACGAQDYVVKPDVDRLPEVIARTLHAA